MRTQYWRPMMLFSWFLVTGAQAVFAQGDPTGQYFYQRDQIPVPYGDPNLVPQYGGMGQAGYPPGANAWPNISPYGPAVSQHYTENGFWFNKIISGNSRYFATMDALITRTGAPPHALIGAEGVNVTTPEAGEIGSQHNQPFFEKVVLSGNGTPERDFTNTGSGGTNDVAIFPYQNAGALKQHIGAGGVRGSWGWWNPDESGFMMQGFWQAKGTSSFMQTDLPLIIDLNETNPSLPSNFINLNFLDQLHPWFGLPLPGPDRDGDGLPGVVVPYDVYIRLDYNSSVYGGNLDWYFSPMYQKDFFKIRGLAGARILRVNETFSFQGADSGMGYTLQPDPDLEDDGGTGGGTTGEITANIADLVIQSVDAQFASPSPSVDNTQGLIFSLLQSRSYGTFAGPEVGLRFDLGGDRFKLWSQSKFGLLAYESTRKLYGYNIGDHFNIITPTALNPDNIPLDPRENGISLNPLRAAGIQGSTFSQEKRTTSVSPMFEQGVFAQVPIFSYVPILNRMAAFEKAEFQAGYTVLVLGSVYRPTNDIDWAQYPKFPTLNDNKGKFYTTNWSVGVNWNY